jgi:two-component system, cell cycle response regulator
MKNSLPLILLACKDPEKVAFFKETLKGSFSLIHAEEIKEALEWLQASNIDVFILERGKLAPPLEDLCKIIQKFSKKKNLPILLVTKSIKRSTILHALNVGITDFIHEPLDALEIEERIAVSLYSKLVSKKMKIVESKIKAVSLLPRNSQILQEKTLIRDKTLKAITSAKSGAVPLGVLMIHIDAVAKLRERIGEVELEDILSYLEIFLQSRLRQNDTFMVEGIGKYLILLPKTSLRAAETIAKDIQKEVASTTINTLNNEVLITVSVGIISFEKGLSKSGSDFEKFDLSLEKVKKSLLNSKEKESTIISNT